MVALKVECLVYAKVVYLAGDWVGPLGLPKAASMERKSAEH